MTNFKMTADAILRDADRNDAQADDPQLDTLTRALHRMTAATERLVIEQIGQALIRDLTGVTHE